MSESSAGPVEAFDYASAPNILDSGVGEEQGRRREREKKKGEYFQIVVEPRKGANCGFGCSEEYIC